MSPPRSPALLKRELERLEDERLAPAAARSAEAKRRHPSLDEGRLRHYRTEFQHDRDRILHSRAFRRLKDKTQVVSPASGDHHRTRLTHALEAAQVARTASRALALNEDLAEAVAMGLNLGASPFGAEGEAVLASLLGGDERAPGYARAWQGLRVVDLLEKRYAYAGLNLCHEVREGILKSHSFWPEDGELDLRALGRGQAPSLEAQLAHAADRLVAIVHDLEDGLRAGLINLRAVERLGAAREVARFLGASLAAPRENYLRGNQLVRGMLHLFVAGLIEHTGVSLAGWCEDLGVSDHTGFRTHRDKLPAGLAALPTASAALAAEAEDFVRSALGNSAAVRERAGQARRILSALYKLYCDDPRLLPDYSLFAFRDRSRRRYLRDLKPGEAAGEIERHYAASPLFHRTLGDFLSGMSDRYARDEYARLTA